MNHTDSKIFQRSYLFRIIRYNVQAAYRGTEPKTDLIRATGRCYDPNLHLERTKTLLVYRPITVSQVT